MSSSVSGLVTSAIYRHTPKLTRGVMQRNLVGYYFRHTSLFMLVIRLISVAFQSKH